jgi:hypothetical protein
VSSGTKQIFIPFSQRLYSSDINRAQKVASADAVELMNHLLLAQTLEDETNGLATFQTTQGNPLFGVIVNGLVFQPGLASANANVTQGLAVVVDPDSTPDPDDSPVKYVRVPATTSPLVLTPNSSGSTRIDVVEVQRANIVSETQTVDVFNTTTGFFTPQSLTKAIQSNFTYRIRLGANGGGFPGTAQGWLPIAVTSVPNGTTTWDTVSLWDVRPLVSDSELTPFNVTARQAPNTRPSYFYLSTANTTNGSILNPSGYLESQFGNARVGGPWQTSVNLQSANYLEGGTTFSANAPYALYLVLPYSLPRWSAYTAASAGIRKPIGPRGLPVLSAKIPGAPNGQAPSALTVPTGLGLTGTFAAAQTVCVAFGYDTSISGFPDNVVSDGEMQYCASHGAGATGANIVASSVNFTLIPGTHFPGNARRLLVRFTANATWANGYVQFTVQTSDLGGGSVQVNSDTTASSPIIKDPSGGSIYTCQAVIPVQSLLPGGTLSPLGRKVTLTYGGSVTGLSIGTANTHIAQVLGWDLGP